METANMEIYTVQSDESKVNVWHPSEAIVIASILSQYSLTPVTITSSTEGDLGSFKNKTYTPGEGKTPVSPMQEVIRVRVIARPQEAK